MSERVFFFKARLFFFVGPVVVFFRSEKEGEADGDCWGVDMR